jgi:hypothetical protein
MSFIEITGGLYTRHINLNHISEFREGGSFIDFIVNNVECRIDEDDPNYRKILNYIENLYIDDED